MISTRFKNSKATEPLRIVTNFDRIILITDNTYLVCYPDLLTWKLMY